MYICACNTDKLRASSCCPFRRLRSTLRAAPGHTCDLVQAFSPLGPWWWWEHGGEGRLDHFSLLFLWQPSITPVRPPTSSVTTGTASPSGGRVTVTWIAKTVLMKIQSAVVSADALALPRAFPMSAVPENRQQTGQEIEWCPAGPGCPLWPLVSPQFLCGTAVQCVGLGYVVLILGQAGCLTACP